MKLIGRILLAAVAYMFGTMVSGMVLAPLHLPTFTLPAGMTMESAFLGSVLAAPLLTAAVLPLALGLTGTWTKRWLAVAGLLFVTLGVNTVIEGVIFTTIFGKAGLWLIPQYILPAAFAAAVLALPFSARAGESKLISGIDGIGWAWRLIAAWLAFPVIYLLFGMCVAPFVVPYYNAGVAGLHIPPMKIIMSVQLLRSALFLAASLPAIFLWTKSRGSLLVAMGLAHAMTVGIYGLVQATWFPMVLRVGHSLEITADSFAYAAVLVLLFTRTVKAEQEKPTANAAVAG